MMEFVSWYYDIPNIWKVIKFHGSSHHQPVYTFCGDGRINCINQLWSSQNNPKLRLVTQLQVLKLWRAFSSQCFTVRNSVRYKLQNNNVLLVKIDGPGAGIPSIIIYPLLKGFLQTPLLINQPMGKGHLCSKNSKYVQKSMNTTQRPKSLHRRFFMNFVHGRPFMKKKYHNFSDEWIQQMG